MVETMYGANSFLPTVASAEAAVQIHEHPARTERHLADLNNQLYAHHRRTGLQTHSPERALMARVRAELRALNAPLILGIEFRAYQEVLRRQKAGEPIAPPEALGYSDFDAHMRNGGKKIFSDEQLAFVRAMSALGVTVARRFFREIWEDDTHRLRPVLDAHHRISSIASGLNYERHVRLHPTPTTNFIANMVTSNSTVLRLLMASGDIGPDSSPYLLPGRPSEALGRAALTTAAWYDRFFPHIGHPRQHVPPLDGGEWRVRPLVNGPPAVPAYCPANVSLYISDWGTIRTGAELHTARALAFATETLWA